MMDVRKKLIELLDTNCGYVDEVKAEVLADHLIANGVTVADKMSATELLTNCQKWISVKDRLPEAGTHVLAYSEDDGVSIVYHGGDSYSYALITHWMPLPEPPKEEV